MVRKEELWRPNTCSPACSAFPILLILPNKENLSDQIRHGRFDRLKVDEPNMYYSTYLKKNFSFSTVRFVEKQTFIFSLFFYTFILDIQVKKKSSSKQLSSAQI